MTTRSAKGAGQTLPYHVRKCVMRNPFRRPRYGVVDPRTGRYVIGQASDKEQAYELAEAFGPGLWVVKVR